MELGQFEEIAVLGAARGKMRPPSQLLAAPWSDIIADSCSLSLCRHGGPRGGEADEAAGGRRCAHIPCDEDHGQEEDPEDEAAGAHPQREGALEGSGTPVRHSAVRCWPPHSNPHVLKETEALSLPFSGARTAVCSRILVIRVIPG